MARAKKPSNGKPREAAAGGPDGKLTLEQLAEMVADPATAPGDLEPYFRVAEDQGAAFDPVVEINTDTVHVPDTAEGRSRSALILNGANWLERNGRQSRFYRLLSKGNYTGPVIVEEGDSWFQYPFKLWDVIDVLMEKYARAGTRWKTWSAGPSIERRCSPLRPRSCCCRRVATIWLRTGIWRRICGRSMLRCNRPNIC